MKRGSEAIFVILALAVLVSCGGGSSNSNGGGTGGTQSQPHSLAVADTFAHRVLIYNAPFVTNQSATVVLGQPDFTTATPATSATGMSFPSATAVDKAGNLYVADNGGGRVLQFRPPFTNGMSASVVIGQPDFVSGTHSVSQNGLDFPVGLAFDTNGNLWVSDGCRVLEYQPPFTTHMNASLVIGQPDFVSCLSSTSSSGFSVPFGIAFDPGGNLWVTDQLNNRILRFQPPFLSGMNASLVIGQPDFVSSGHATSATGLFEPWSIASDNAGNLWVSDTQNSRVLQYKPPFSNGMSASLVLGQSDFTTSMGALTQSGFGLPRGIAFDSGGNLWVADAAHNRTLEFSPPFSTAQNAALVLGQAKFSSGGAATTATGENNPTSVSPF